MADHVLGEVIRESREAQGITQEDLCSGLCNVSTLSKIENGKQQPRRATMVALLQRLGLYADRYYGLCNMEELALESLKLEIKNANARDDYAQALALLDQLVTQFSKERDPIFSQFILTTQAINGCQKEDVIVQYSPSEQRNMLLKSIGYTVPRFSVEHIDKLLLSLDEVIIVENIANSYSKEGQYGLANTIYEPILKYAENHLLPVSEASLIIPLLTYNYSRSLCRNNQYREGLEIAQLGIDCCVRYGKSRLFGELLINKACAMHRLCLGDGGRAATIRSYYLLDSMEMTRDAEIVRQYLWDTHGVEPI